MPALKFHEIAEVFPLFPEDRLRSLADSIAVNGLRHPIVLFEGAILDGRNRYRAAKVAGYETQPRDFVDFAGTWDDALQFVADENLERRDLNPDQRALAAARLAQLGRGRPSSENAATGGISLADAAEKVGVSRSRAERARSVLNRGASELADSVARGEVTVRAAADIAKLPADEQKKTLAGGPEAVKDAVAGVRARARPLVRPEPTESEIAARRGQVANDLVDRLIAAVKIVEQAASKLAAGETSLSQGSQEIVLMAAGRLRSGADWVAALIKGDGFSDEALAAWLRGESQ